MSRKVVQPGIAPAPAAARAPGALSQIGSDDKFLSKFSTLIRASYRILFVATPERDRAELEIQSMASSMGQNGYAMVTWDCHQGFNMSQKGNSEEAEKYKNPIFALDFVLNKDAFSKATIIVMRNLDDYFAEPRVRQRLETFAQCGMDNPELLRTIVIISPNDLIHEKLKPMITVVPLALPDETKLRRVVDSAVASVESRGTSANCAPELREKLAAALLGCNHLQADNIMSSTVIEQRGRFTDEMVFRIQAEKASVIKSDGVLSFIPRDRLPKVQDVGGYSSLIDWLTRAREAYTPEAAAIKLDLPKGIVLVGPPGTGKSAVAKICGAVLDLPVFMFNVAAVFGHLVGESERRMRTALGQIESLKGSVVILDEADKALAGAKDSSGDTSGVTRRVFGQILTWLAEKEDRTFVILTLNRTSGLDPELLRAGRFDDMFYTDMPTPAERRQILEIHFRKRGLEPAALQLADGEWQTVADSLLKDFVGSEIEQAVVNARRIAFADGKRSVPTFADISQAIAEITPLARRDSLAISSIREFCKTSGGRPVNGISGGDSMTSRTGRKGRALDVPGTVSEMG